MLPIALERQRRIVLASRSPRRLDLLRRLGFDPIVVPAEIDEVRHEGEEPATYTRRLSHSKAVSVARQVDVRESIEASPYVLAADTIVVLGDEVLEKPANEDGARRMLQRLSGRWHDVITSFTVVHAQRTNRATTRTVSSGVQFRALTDREIDGYVASGEPLDKAGSYGIQHLGAFLVREVRGSYFAVVGLPVCELIETLLSIGAVTAFPFLQDEAPTPPGPESTVETLDDSVRDLTPTPHSQQTVLASSRTDTSTEAPEEEAS